MKNKGSVFLVLIVLLATHSFAGIRGPGKYNGVVVFDRWDACYIHSGPYLMYVSEKTKGSLRKYQGRSLVIDAIEVYQPINPGDGRIGFYKILGESKTKRPNVVLEGLKLTVSPSAGNDSYPQFRFEIRNESDKPIEVRSSELALTLLRKKEAGDAFFDPSDGPSYAMITRYSLGDSRWHGTSNNLNEGATWSIGRANRLPNSFTLQTGKTRVIPVSLRLPAGEYDFLWGYGGGVHYDRSIASNLTAFDVDKEGRATFINIPGR
jgi:hypothetical protein